MKAVPTPVKGRPPHPELGLRNAFEDHAKVKSNMIFEGQSSVPSVSIAIPTYRRPHLLVEAVSSALAQDFDLPIEVLVVDNDPDSKDLDILRDGIPDISRTPFRYYINEENIGMFGNFNRCIELSQGSWMAILNDDDIIDTDFLKKMFSYINNSPNISGIVCRKRMLYQSAVIGAPSRFTTRSILRRVLLEMLFLGRDSRRVGLRKLFWGLFIGNSAGFLFKKRAAMEIGGFYPEDKGSADYWFTTRLAAMYEVRQHRTVAATVRVAENETGQIHSVMGQMESALRLRIALSRFAVPRWWKRLIPLITARDRVAYKESWNVDVPDDELTKMVGTDVPRDRPYLYWLTKLLLRGY